MKRQYLQLFGYDNSKVRIPIAKGSYWFTQSHGEKCVVGCKNYPDTVYISDYGYASRSYCRAHAELCIIKNLIHGTNDRGIFVYCVKGKIKPLWIYKEIIKSIKDSVKLGKSYIQSLKLTEQKLADTPQKEST